MSEITTGAALGQYYKDLLDGGIPVETAAQAVLIAAQGMTRDGELKVTLPVSA